MGYAFYRWRAMVSIQRTFHSSILMLELCKLTVQQALLTVPLHHGLKWLFVVELLPQVTMLV
jgi:hypothetical protein